MCVSGMMIWSCTDDNGHGTFFIISRLRMEQCKRTIQEKGMLCKSISARMCYVYDGFSLHLCLKCGWICNSERIDNQLRTSEDGMTLIEVTQALYPAATAADIHLPLSQCVLYSLLPYFFLLRSSTNMATRPSPQQAPQTYQFKLVLLGK